MVKLLQYAATSFPGRFYLGNEVAPVCSPCVQHSCIIRFKLFQIGVTNCLLRPESFNKDYFRFRLLWERKFVTPRQYGRNLTMLVHWRTLPLQSPISSKSARFFSRALHVFNDIIINYCCGVHTPNEI